MDACRQKVKSLCDKSALRRRWLVTWPHENTSARIKESYWSCTCLMKLLLRTGKHALKNEDLLGLSSTESSFASKMHGFFKFIFLWDRRYEYAFSNLVRFFSGKHDVEPPGVIFLLFPCVFLLLQTSGRCCGLCGYLMQWAVSRVSGVSPRVSETVSSSWRWTPPSTPTPPASTSHPAWSCATGHPTSELMPGSLCRQSPVKRHGPLAGFKPVTTWSSTIRMEAKGCEYRGLIFCLFFTVFVIIRWWACWAMGWDSITRH